MNTLSKLAGGARAGTEEDKGEMIVELRLADLRLDGGTQSREGINHLHVQALVEARERGDILPPIEVYFDGDNRWLVDGFHRFQAHKKMGLETMRARVLEGTQREAILASVGKNSNHGLPRTHADKRRAVSRLLEDIEWRQWSDREIARLTGTSHTFVGGVRAELDSVATRAYVSKRTYERDGKTQTMETGSIGKTSSRLRRVTLDGEAPPAQPTGEAFERGAETLEEAASSAKTWEEHLADAYPEAELGVPAGEEAPPDMAEFGTVVVNIEDSRALRRFSEACAAFLALAASKPEAVLAWLATNGVDERVEALMRDYAEAN